jgi:hypothetical protein
MTVKTVRIVGLCLMAVFAFNAVAASSASAAPGLLLARVAGGGSIAGVTFLSSANLPLLTTQGESSLHCKNATGHGLFLSPTLGDILIRFSGCTTSELTCGTLGSGNGEIHLPLVTTLFNLGLAHLTNTVGKIPAVGILLNKDVEIACDGLVHILVLGALIGALQLDLEPGFQLPIPLGQPVSRAILNFQQKTNGFPHLRLILFEDQLRAYDLHSLTTLFGFEGSLSSSAEVALYLLDLFRLSNGNHVAIELFED